LATTTYLLSCFRAQTGRKQIRPSSKIKTWTKLKHLVLLELQIWKKYDLNSFEIAKFSRFFRLGKARCENLGQVLVLNEGWTCYLPV
jgi:hypothetical protein